MNATIYTLKQQKAEIMRRLWAFTRQFRHWEPTAQELATFERDKRAVMAINAAIERQEAARPLTRTTIREQLEAILQQEQEAMYRSQPRRR